VVWSTQVKHRRRRHIEQAQAAESLGPKGAWPSPGAANSPGADVEPPAYRCGLLHSVMSAERGKPDVLPAPHTKEVRERKPQGEPTGQQVKEEGESECRAVMVRIGVAPQGNITPRESGQTSLWSGVTREPGQQTSGGDADMSAAATLAGAVPERGNTVCLLQVGIVKVSSGKPRRAESGRFDRAVGAILLRRG